MSVISFLMSYVDTTTVVVGLTVFLIVWWLCQPRDLAPGPWSLPVVGLFPFIMKKKPEDFEGDLYKKHGPVVRFFLGSMEQINILNYEAAKESFIKHGDILAGTIQEIGFKVNETDTGIGLLEGEPWKEHRRFILSTFRDFGMGKHSLEPRITEEIQMFTKELTKTGGQSVNWAELMGTSVSNVICALEFGSRFEYDDEEFLRMKRLLSDSERLVQAMMVKLAFPWMRFIPFFDYLSGWDVMVKTNQEMKDFFTKKIAEHRAVYQEGSLRDFIDAFLTEKEKVLEKTGDASSFTDDVLRDTLIFLFFAGSETIVATMKWALAMLLLHPDIMKKVRKEVDDVIGMERTPSISDRAQMVYTEAFFNEVHRFGSVVPNIIHTNLEEINVLGYRIPKRSYVGGCLRAIHHDGGLWEDPETFRPERFIDENSKLKKTDHLLAFGVGKRNCIGESLARMELFLYFTSLLQRFDFKVPEGETISLETSMSFTRNPKLYKLCFIPRKGYQ